MTNETTKRSTSTYRLATNTSSWQKSATCKRMHQSKTVTRSDTAAQNESAENSYNVLTLEELCVSIAIDAEISPQLSRPDTV